MLEKELNKYIAELREAKKCKLETLELLKARNHDSAAIAFDIEIQMLTDIISRLETFI